MIYTVSRMFLYECFMFKCRSSRFPYHPHPELSECEGICLLDSTSDIPMFPLTYWRSGTHSQKADSCLPPPATLPVLPPKFSKPGCIPLFVRWLLSAPVIPSAEIPISVKAENILSTSNWHLLLKNYLQILFNSFCAFSSIIYAINVVSGAGAADSAFFFFSETM